MVDALSSFAAWLFQWIGDGAEWLLDVLLYIPRTLYADLATGALEVVNLIPCVNACYQTLDAAKIVLTGSGVPNVHGNTSVIVSWLSSLLYVSALAVGLELMMCALLARFLLRRIPFIG